MPASTAVLRRYSLRTTAGSTAAATSSEHHTRRFSRRGTNS